MSFLGAFGQTFAAGHLPADAVTKATAAVYQPYYAHGPRGETLYLWPAFPQSPELSPGSSDYSPPPPSYIPGSPGSVSTALPASQAVIGQVVDSNHPGVPVKNMKRRVTANRKERRRTLSINTAFAELRDCIPNVPADTKLSKIKTLRLATSYIAYLMDVLAQDDSGRTHPQLAFKSEVKSENGTPDDRKKFEMTSLVTSCVSPNDRKSRGRTGWPQHVWALELKQENTT